mmetsp:Transcript_23810/g.33339  ORF Transcript_23810/g.33339 Transcript_23810/m.33339 type:complete len:316 (+) Transcript_23810:461-1408(+)|eukprot:CAMPEP_0184483606 /NCGR_PEP_ID=MMETSP0113_2-20130426/5291_1 /TAXON_ID=91329 /ORGANISM="Norrisiella sphaerica, Strain BC52" /LENGTH=315 /DNA_ID=CAMNT_0026864139 /DNA_START=405 /DNA_END=1352 /DNA_ORIENTATION=-
MGLRERAYHPNSRYNYYYQRPPIGREKFTAPKPIIRPAYDASRNCDKDYFWRVYIGAMLIITLTTVSIPSARMTAEHFDVDIDRAFSQSFRPMADNCSFYARYFTNSCNDYAKSIGESIKPVAHECGKYAEQVGVECGKYAKAIGGGCVYCANAIGEGCSHCAKVVSNRFRGFIYGQHEDVLTIPCEKEETFGMDAYATHHNYPLERGHYSAAARRVYNTLLKVPVIFGAMLGPFEPFATNVATAVTNVLVGTLRACRNNLYKLFGLKIPDGKTKSKAPVKTKKSTPQGGKIHSLIKEKEQAERRRGSYRESRRI